MTLDKSHFIEVLGSKMHYLEEGVGAPILFLHGIPTSSYLWRNVMPRLSLLGRCIAPDLIGMGLSDKPDIEYSIDDHIRYIDNFIKQLNLKRITLVMHGWGSIMGLHYAMQHPENCRGLVMYESYLRPLDQDDTSLPMQEQLHYLAAQKNSDELILNSSFFVDKVIPQGFMQTIDDDVLEVYRKPFKMKQAGKPLQKYIDEMLQETSTSAVNRIISEYAEKLIQSKMPKLLLYSLPGFITTMGTIMWAKHSLPNLQVVDIGEELHYAQESNPVLMGDAISIWLQSVEQTTG